MTRFSTSLIAVAAFGLATPMVANAAPKTAAEAEVSAPAQALPAPTQRYCFVDKLTGSNIERRECKTLAAWLAVGIDPRTRK